MNNLNQDIKYCKRYLQKYGKSYFFATQFFPAKLRGATYALYAFVRIADEYVDNENNSKNKLKRFKKEWLMAYKNKSSTNPIFNATSNIFHLYQIPFQYSLDFIQAMEQDIYKTRYKSYTELKHYMYGSAAVIGLMMSYLIGFNNKLALKHAKELGFAMQLTNFIRDIGEDYTLRNRIYLPNAELKKFHVSEKNFKNKLIDANFKKLLKFNIKRARKLYSSSQKGLKYLQPQGRRAVNTALILYRAILNKIEQNNYDVFNQRAHTTFLEKIRIVLGG